MAIGQLLDEQDETAVKALAVRYQLISRHTNYLVVDFRTEGEQGEHLPVLHKVPQMLAAGWGGTGTVLGVGDTNVCYSASRSVKSPSRPDARFSRAVSGSDVQFSMSSTIDWRQQTSPQRFLEKCGWRHTRWLLPVLRITSYGDLVLCDLPDRILEALKAIVANSAPKESEATIVLAFLQSLASSTAQLKMSRNFRRALRRGIKKTPPNELLLAALFQAFADIGEDDWGPNYPLIEKGGESDDDND